jgi:hypothetical protein
MDADDIGQDAPPSNAAAPPAGKIAFSRFVHEMKAKNEIPLAHAVAAHLGVRKRDYHTATFTRDELQKAVADLLTPQESA